MPSASTAAADTSGRPGGRDLYLVLQRHTPWVAAVVVGALLLGSGVYMIVQGVAARNEVRDELRAEQITTSPEARIPSRLIDDAATAKAQADLIEEHTLGRWGPFSALPRDDPRRAQFIDGVALRSALNMAVMGLRLTELVIGLGAIVSLAGLLILTLTAPSLYFLSSLRFAGSCPWCERATRAEAARGVGGAGSPG